MYILILVLLIGAGLWTLLQGIERSSRGRITGGVAILAGTAGFFGLMRWTQDRGSRSATGHCCRDPAGHETLA